MVTRRAPERDEPGPTSAASDPDAALVAACQARGPRSCDREFRELYERHRDRVYRTCHRLTGNEADALDAAQETFRIVYFRLDRFHGRSRFSTWLYRVACNASLDVRASSWRRRALSLDEMCERSAEAEEEPPDDGSGCPIHRVSHVELQERIQTALTRLSPKYRQVIVLRYLEGRSYAEIAAVLRVALGTVKSRMTRAHRALDRELRPLLQSFVA